MQRGLIYVVKIDGKMRCWTRSKANAQDIVRNHNETSHLEGTASYEEVFEHPTEGA